MVSVALFVLVCNNIDELISYILHNRMSTFYVPMQSSNTIFLFIGIAPIAGVCSTTRNCNINEDLGLSTAFVIAHEVGHG